MFTGIVETVGQIVGIESQAELVRLTVRAAQVVEGVELGDSVAINGACLTVCAIAGDTLSFEAVRETLEKTNLGDLALDSRVNVERAMRADDRLDGHIVQGHVDGVGRLRELERRGDDVRLFVDCDADFADLLVEKGSVTIDGVSLTVVSVEPEGFDVVLIPHTLAETTLGERRTGDRLNLEADILGKYVKKYVSRILSEHARQASGG